MRHDDKGTLRRALFAFVDALAMNDLMNLTGRLWSQASKMLLARGFEANSVRVLDITPERAPRTPQQQFGWGHARVVRARQEGEQVVVTIAREMKV